MRFNTQLKIKDRAMNRIFEICDRGITQHKTHDEVVNEVVNKVFQDDDVKKLPQYWKYYLRGIADTHYELIHRKHTHWRVRYLGKLVVGKTDVPQGEWHKVKEGAFVWNSDPKKIYSASYLDPKKQFEYTTTSGRLTVYESSTRFNIKMRGIDGVRSMGDGVDQFFDVEDHQILVGTPEFYEALISDIESGENDYIEAYFGDIEETQQ